MTLPHSPDAEQLLAHATFVRAVALATLKGDDLVDDVVQATWVAALEGQGKRRGGLGPWLAGIARNQARNLVRRRAAHRRQEKVACRPERVEADQAVVDRLEIQRHLVETVAALPEAYRTPLVLRYLEELPPREIAVRLDLPVETVRTRVRRGLAELRRRLEARHGASTHDWRLVLLPFLEPRPVPHAAATATGGLMAKKLFVPVIALLLLGGAGVLVGRAVSRTKEPGASGPREIGRTAAAAQHREPVLAGRPGEREVGPVPPPSASPPAEGSVRPEIDPEQVRDAMTALIADIRREVEPAWWGEHPTHGTLEGKNGVLIVRAPSDVLDGVAEYLDQRRRGGPIEDPEAAPPDPSTLAAARASLQQILAGILDRARTLESSLTAWTDGRSEEAKRLAAAVLAVETDNMLARALQDPAAWKEGMEPDAVLKNARSVLDGLRKQSGLRMWATCWTSRSTWEALNRVLAGVGGGVTLRQLAPDLSEQLERGDVTVGIRDARLTEVVRRLQIASLVDVRLGAQTVKEADQVRISELRAEARPLSWILDELVHQLPEGWAWYTARQQVVVTKHEGDGAPPPATRVRYFDVKDLVVRGHPSLDVEATRIAPPTPPVYRTNPEGVVVPAERPGTGEQARER